MATLTTEQQQDVPDGTTPDFLVLVENEVNNHLVTIKIVLAVGIFVIGLISVLAPQRLVASEGAQHWFSLGNMAASGVLLSAGLVHMLADSAEVLNGNTFPMANFVAGLTFIAFMVMEEILHVVFMTKDCSAHDHGDGEGCSSDGQGGASGGASGGAINLAEVLMAGHSHDHRSHGRQHQQQNNEVSHDHHHNHNHHNQKEEGPTNSHSHDHDHHSSAADERQPLLLSNHHNKISTTSTTTTPPMDSNSFMIRSSSITQSGRPKPSCCGGCVGQPSTYAPPLPAPATTNGGVVVKDGILEQERGGGGGGDHHHQHHHNHFHGHHSHEHQDHHQHSYQRRDSSRLSISQRLSTTIGVSELPEHHHHHEDHLELHLHGSVVATFVLMLALSIHAILAGVSIGIENSPEDIVATAFAILAHKSFEGFCLGSSLVSSKLQGISFWSLSMGWTIATPLGIAIGQGILQWAKERREQEEEADAAMNEDDDPDPDSQNSVALVKAIVAGTFLYVAIVEIGSKELLACRHDDQQHGSKFQKYVDIGKLICFVVGFIAMSILALWS